MSEGGFVYLLTNRRQGALYTGVTSDLLGRIWQHRNGTYQGFTAEHGIKRLMWSERHDGIEGAIRREKQIKTWNRAWKIELIEKHNPEWDDLAVSMLRFDPL